MTLPSASLAEDVQFNQLVIVPNAVQGIFRRRPTAVRAAAMVDADGRAVRFVAGLRDKRGRGPLWIHLMRDRVLLLLDVDDVRRVLEGSPHPFAADPPAKRKGMGHFQPDALTLSRGELWERRRRFTEAVLDSPSKEHRLAERFGAVVVEEVRGLLDDVGLGSFGYDEWHAAFRRIVRRVVLGDAARDDEPLSDLLADLMSEANSLPSNPSPRFDEYADRVREYVDAAAEGSLAGLFASASPEPDVRAERQVTHWLFALQDTLAANTLRALALLAVHDGPEPDLAATLQEAMRLWPTTPLLSRETLVDLTWAGDVVPAGTQVLIYNTFFHRDPQLPYADRFAPEEWTSGDAASSWRFNHFSHGPQGCPGANLAVFVGTAAMAELLRSRTLELLEPSLELARPLPHMLDFFRIRLAIEAGKQTARRARGRPAAGPRSPAGTSGG